MQHPVYDRSTDTSNTRADSHVGVQYALNNIIFVLNDADANLRVDSSSTRPVNTGCVNRSPVLTNHVGLKHCTRMLFQHSSTIRLLCSRAPVRTARDTCVHRWTRYASFLTPNILMAPNTGEVMYDNNYIYDIAIATPTCFFIFDGSASSAVYLTSTPESDLSAL